MCKIKLSANISEDKEWKKEEMKRLPYDLNHEKKPPVWAFTFKKNDKASTQPCFQYEQKEQKLYYGLLTLVKFA